jgi:hypothetical protein
MTIDKKIDWICSQNSSNTDNCICNYNSRTCDYIEKHKMNFMHAKWHYLITL